MRADYTEFVALANEGAHEQGFKDLGVMWRSGYDMAPEAFDADTERLWQQGQAAVRRAALLRARPADAALRRGARAAG